MDLTLEYYAEFGIAPTLIVDSKTTDDTLKIADKFECKAVVTHNPTTRAQYIIEAGARAITTPWALRMDDDELPTREMLDYISDAAHRLPPEAIVGFVRHQCTIRDRALWVSTKYGGENYRQWRLFQPSKARFIETGHTPGFEVPTESRISAPDEAAMLHFDWIVRSPEERSAKIERYDAHTPNHGSTWRNYYLADVLDDQFDSQLTPLTHSGFESYARKLGKRFPSQSRATRTKPARSAALRIFSGLRRRLTRSDPETSTSL